METKHLEQQNCIVSERVDVPGWEGKERLGFLSFCYCYEMPKTNILKEKEAPLGSVVLVHSCSATLGLWEQHVSW